MIHCKIRQLVNEIMRVQAGVVDVFDKHKGTGVKRAVRWFAGQNNNIVAVGDGISVVKRRTGLDEIEKVLPRMPALILAILYAADVQCWSCTTAGCSFAWVYICSDL